MQKLGLLAAGIVLLVAAPALAQPDQPDVLPKEFTCMSAQTKYASRFWAAKVKCVSRCMIDFWKGYEPHESNCLPPYGGATALCVNDSVFGLKGAENKFENSVVKTCVTGPGANCPECYAPAGCGTGPAQDLVQQHEAQLDSTVPGIFCERSGAVAVEQKCQLNTAKVVAKYFGLRNKCYTKCLVDQRSGGDTTTCLPPATAPKAIVCLERARQKSILAIDTMCDETLRPDAQPECGGAYANGTFWAGFIDTVVDSAIAPTFCASPSGAFVD